MGGPGSGAWIRWDKKGTIEEYYCLDVRKFHGIKSEDWITVQYDWQGEQLAQEVYFDWTPCNFGGHRKWLKCMLCGRKVAKLYLRGKYFACRHCHKLTYRSCQESDSRFREFLKNYNGLGESEVDLPIFALNGLWSRIEKDQLQRKMNQRRRGRP